MANQHGQEFCFRLLAYSVITAGVMQSVNLLVQNGFRETLFSENGPLEWLHFILAGAAACWMITVGRRTNPVISIFGCIALFAASRELDGLLGNDSYKFVLFPLVATATSWIYLKHRDTVVQDFFRAASSPAWGLMVTGGITVCVFAQIIGQKELWMEVMGDAYMR